MTDKTYFGRLKLKCIDFISCYQLSQFLEIFFNKYVPPLITLKMEVF